jgi:hypothetical protein
MVEIPGMWRFGRVFGDTLGGVEDAEKPKPQEAF